MKKNILYLFLILMTIISCKTKSQNNKNDPNTREKQVNAFEINKKIKNNKDIYYKNSTITGDIIFSESAEENRESFAAYRNYVNSSITFVNCTFKGKIKAFYKDKDKIKFTTFNKNLTFLKCTFQDSFEIREADIIGQAIIQDCEFQEYAGMPGTLFRGGKNYIVKNKFLKQAKFPLTVFRGEISFFSSEFYDNVNFKNAVFFEKAQFSAVKFDKISEFSSSVFRGECFFNYAEFSDKSFFDNVTFSARTEYISCKFEKKTYFDKSIFKNNLNLSKSTISDTLFFKKALFYKESPNLKSDNLSKNTQIILKNTLILRKDSITLKNLY